ncbi:hypothetical protein ARMGADRAFT_1034234 [Armillaria gallica]|uniref:Uncharacterized protein n=1 Tax=Armillaria gallica TaxID=47427 RepID=A0A2H3DLE9_ARMGA|nr:hypothetical protein ARMGADRAFT_1034234 [Armillaria gallica]
MIVNQRCLTVMGYGNCDARVFVAYTAKIRGIIESWQCYGQRNEIVIIPVGTVFAFTQLRSTMPGAPEGFGDVLGVLPCLVLLSICAVTMVGMYVFTDPAKDSHEKLTWSALVNTLAHLRNTTSERHDPEQGSYTMLPL